MNYEEQIKEYIDSSIVYTKEIFQNLGDNFLLPVYISAYYTAVCIDTFRNDELSKNIMEFSITNYCDSEELSNFYFEIIEDFIYIITNENNYIGRALFSPDSIGKERIEKKLAGLPALALLFDFLYYSNTDKKTFYIKRETLNNKIPTEFWKCNNIYYHDNKRGWLLRSLEYYLCQHEKIQTLYSEYEKNLIDTSLLILNTIKDMVDTEIETRQTQQTNKKTSKFRTPKAKKAILKSGFFGVIFGILITLFIHSVAGESLNIGYYFAIFIVTVFFTIVARISLLSCD